MRKLQRHRTSADPSRVCNRATHGNSMDGIQAKYPNQGLPLGSIHPHESEKEVIMQARMDLRKCVWVLAVVLGSGVVGGSLRAAPSPRSQEHAQEQDYSKN